MKKIFISPGDPSGIGPEITLKALAKNKSIQNHFIIGGDANYFEGFAKKLKLNLKFDEEGSESENLKIKHFPLDDEIELGNPKINHSNYIIDVLSYGSLGCLSKKYHGLVTGPINKELINKSGFEFSGHTEFLADISNVKKVVMLLMNKSLKVALLTTHIPLSEVPKKVTLENLKKTIDIIDHDLVEIWKIKQPKIGILGLNPHAGEGGFLGSEEEEIIKPFIKSSKKDLYGPISADTAFIPKNIKKYDLFLAMFHDQGLPVIKSLGFGDTLNITLGLPFLRISVDHGTAYEIANKNVADFSSMDEALKKAYKLLEK
tara:strand:+ start:104 stop:1054 length:951 start_codon:yes stop_codon:yes gene_type:complete